MRWFKKRPLFFVLGLSFLLSLGGCAANPVPAEPQAQNMGEEAEAMAYDTAPYIVLADNIPDFADEEKITESFEVYGELDVFARCSAAYACLGQDLMPTEPRGEIGAVKPTGWHTVKYDCVEGKYLYNRCHLIGFQLAGENANERNLITGTRYMNVEGMLPFENMVADYIKETNHHVLYRVTPVFEGDNLLASGVQMEAYSVEDEGAGICFNVYVYNVQPGVELDYATGESRLAEADLDEMGSETYILNVNTKKFHLLSCASVQDMADENRKEYTGTREALLAQGYEPCKRCQP